MNQAAAQVVAEGLDRTVRMLCEFIGSQKWHDVSRPVLHEGDLRRALVACALGSQVTYQMASAAVENLEAAGLLADRWWEHVSEPRFGSLARTALSGKLQYLPHRSRYRFPQAAAKRLAGMRDELAILPVRDRIQRFGCMRQLRAHLVGALPGIGPKQASMFLRNIGLTYDLAILDVHVIRFMTRMNLISAGAPVLDSITRYERLEHAARVYAASTGYPVGYLDWAIWATMKAASELSV